VELPPFSGQITLSIKGENMSKSRPPYPVAFRQQILELVKAGKDPKVLAEEFGCHAKTIQNWIKEESRETYPTRGSADSLSCAERQELIALRKQLKQVQMERDILAKATAWFAHNGVAKPSSTN